MKTLALVFVLFSIVILGNMDYEDAQLEQQDYCTMVAQGHWHDYDKSINCEWRK